MQACEKMIKGGIPVFCFLKYKAWKKKAGLF